MCFHHHRILWCIQCYLKKHKMSEIYNRAVLFTSKRVNRKQTDIHVISAAFKMPVAPAIAVSNSFFTISSVTSDEGLKKFSTSAITLPCLHIDTVIRTFIKSTVQHRQYNHAIYYISLLKNR